MTTSVDTLKGWRECQSGQAPAPAAISPQLAAVKHDGMSISVDVLQRSDAEPLAQWLADNWQSASSELVSAALGDKALAWADKLIEVLGPAEAGPQVPERQRA